MRAYIKSILRSVKGSVSRFFAIFTIVALGVGFMAGLLSTPGDMRHSVEVLYNESQFMDIRVLSNLGMCDEDVEALRSLPGVADVMPANTVDYLVTTDGQDSMVARIHDMIFSLQRDNYDEPGLTGAGSLNQAVLMEGRWPQDITECVVELEAGFHPGLELGGTITVTAENKDVEDTLGTQSFTVVGYVVSGAYLSKLQRGYSTVGNGKIATIVYIDPACFVTDYYTDVYIRLDGSDRFEVYSAEYDEFADLAIAAIESFGETQKYVRQNAILGDARQQLTEARETLAEKRLEAEAELEEALNQLLEAQEELTEGQQELVDGRRKVIDGWRDYDKGVADLENGRREYQDEIAEAQKKIAESEAELVEAEAEIADGWQQLPEGEEKLAEGEAQLAEGEAELAVAKADYQQGLETLTEAKAQLDEKQPELEAGKLELDDAKTQLDASRIQLDESKTQLDEGWIELEDGQRQLEDGRKKLEEAKILLETGRAEIAAGERQLAEAEQQIQEVEKEIVDGEARLETAKEVLAIARQAFETANENKEALQALLDSVENPTVEEIIAGMEQYLEENQVAYEEAKAKAEPTEADRAFIAIYEQIQVALTNSEELLEQWWQIEGQLQDVDAMIALAEERLIAAEEEVAANQALLDEGKARLAAGRKDIEDAKAQLAEGRRQLADGQREYNAGIADLEQAEIDLANARLTLEEGNVEWEEGNAQWEEGYAKWADGYAKWADGYAKWEDGYTQWIDGVQELEEGRLELEEAEKQIAENRLEIEEGKKEIAENRLKLEDGERQMNEGKAELEQAKLDLAVGMMEAEEKFADVESQLADAYRQLQESETNLVDGEVQLVDGETELTDGWKEYQKAVAEVENKLEEAQDEITKAEDKLKDIESPKWYVLGRNTNPGYVTYDGDSQKIAAIAKVFPVFFLLVAALVASTTMTRMVEEERGGIGTLKALGYTNGAIAAKFLAYAGFAAVLGSLVGLFIGLRLFPGIIYDAYGLMYNLPDMTPGNHLSHSLLSMGAIVGSIMLTTATALKSSLSECAAALMQPKAPKAGKRIFLERITPLWKKMRFTHKVTARNLLRYKKRFFMTVVGIFGCTALLLGGFGLRDSISDIIDIQYGQLFTYNMSVTIKHEGDAQSDRRIRQVLEDTTVVFDYTAISQETVILYKGDVSIEVTATVPKDTAVLPEYINFRQRVSGEPVGFDSNSVLISEKAAKTLGIKIGDTIQAENSELEVTDFIVTGIVENYVQGYIYIAPELFERAYTAPVAYTTLLVHAADGTEEIRDEIASRLLNSPNVASAQFTTGLRKTFNDMLSTIDFIVIVIILCAGLLAFVVMYNLTNINITERQKELATIKVLGFYQNEVNMYIYRETMILTVVGALVGLVGGIFLHQFIIVTAEVDSMMFGRTIQPISYLIAFAVTLCFSLVVNFIMSFKMKAINMADSLKAPE